MEKLFLEVPSLKRKQHVLDYLDENIKYNSDLNGVGSIDKILEGKSYEEWLLELEKGKNLEYISKINKLPSKTFFVIRESDDKIVGMINVRYKVSFDILNTWGSHIGYGIRPTERRKGYGKIALYLSLLEEQKLGEEKVLLKCTTENIGSNKIILDLGGKLEKTYLDPYDGEMTNNYWINVDEMIKRYSNEYERLIIRK